MLHAGRIALGCNVGTWHVLHDTGEVRRLVDALRLGKIRAGLEIKPAAGDGGVEAVERHHVGSSDDHHVGIATGVDGG